MCLSICLKTTSKSMIIWPVQFTCLLPVYDRTPCLHVTPNHERSGLDEAKGLARLTWQPYLLKSNKRKAKLRPIDGYQMLAGISSLRSRKCLLIIKRVYAAESSRFGLLSLPSVVVEMALTSCVHLPFKGWAPISIVCMNQLMDCIAR